MHAALAVVDDAIHVAQRPASVVGAGGDVAGVGAADRVAAIHRIKHGAINNFAGEAAVADSDILVVPLRGQPDFKTKLRKNRADDAAERGNRARCDPSGAEHTGGNRGSGADRDPRQRQPIQFLAALGLR